VNRLTCVVWLTVVALLAMACQTGPTSAGGDEIVIASDLATTGGNEDFGLPLQQAIELAIRQQGSIAGLKLVFMPLDNTLGSAPSATKGVQNVKRMISDSRVLGMIGPPTSKTAYAEIPVANSANLVMLNPSNTNRCITLPAPYCSPQPADLRANGPNNYFRIAPPESVQGRAMARFVTSTLKLQRVAAFNEWVDEGEFVTDSFKDELTRGGGSLVLRSTLPAGTLDFTRFLAEARANRAQAIYAVSGDSNDHVCVAAAQAKSVFPQGVYFLGTDVVVDDAVCLKDAVNAGNGMVGTLTDVDLTQSTDEAAKTAVQAYRKAFPKTSNVGLNTYIFAAYDCARLLIDAISRAIETNAGRIPTRLQVLQAVAHTQGFKGVTGSYSFDANGDAISPLMSISEVQNGGWVYLRQVDASANPS
jgi:branched-chain amino acid transport system substrate-binding protein